MTGVFKSYICAMSLTKPRLVLAVLLFITAAVHSQNLEALKLDAEAGDPKAQVNLGNAYYYGDGIPQNLGESARWYGKAAEQGNAEGQFNLEYAYYAYLQGKGVAQDDGEAAFWFIAAAEKN